MELALGTVQFGLAYGINGRQAPIDDAEARDILAAAWDMGIRRLDTAAAYGNIESRLAALCDDHRFGIVSKIPAFKPDLPLDEAIAFVVGSIRESRARLGDRLIGILFHDASNVAGLRGASIWDAAYAAAETAGLSLGSSGYAPRELEAMCALPGFAMAQLPGNALDQRITATPALARSAEVTVRSAFLQGLLLMDIERVRQAVPAALPAIQTWRSWCEGLALPPLEAAFSIAKNFADVAYCVIGVDNVAQLEANCAAWSASKGRTAPHLASVDPAIIDPRLWPAVAG